MKTYFPFFALLLVVTLPFFAIVETFGVRVAEFLHAIPLLFVYIVGAVLATWLIDYSPKHAERRHEHEHHDDRHFWSGWHFFRP